MAPRSRPSSTVHVVAPSPGSNSTDSQVLHPNNRNHDEGVNKKLTTTTTIVTAASNSNLRADNQPSSDSRSCLPRETVDPLESLPRNATEEEIAALPHVIDRIPFPVWAVMFGGAMERVTYYAVVTPWQNYAQNKRHDPALPGALGLGQSTATNISSAFFFFSFLMPLPFAVLSDIYLARYKTLLLGMFFYLVGAVVIFTTSLPRSQDAGVAPAGFGISLFFIGLGAGAVRGVFIPFLGDQYQQRPPQLVRRKNGKMVIVDGSRTLQFIYNANYWFVNIASLSSIPATYLEHIYDFWAAYLLCVCSSCAGIALFLLWSRKLVKSKPGKNILPMVVKLLCCAIRNGFKLDKTKPAYQLEHNQKTVPWSDLFVDQIKSALTAARVIFSLVIFYLCVAQIFNNLISQAGQMELHGLPNDFIQSFSGIACIIFGPLIQLLYSELAKRKISFGPILRITLAFIFCGAAIAYAAGVQQLIYSAPPCYNMPFKCPASEGGRKPNAVNVWIQLPVFFILAVAEIFGFVTTYEYAYQKAPKEMKSVLQATTSVTGAAAAALGIALSPAAKDPGLVIYYSSLAGTMGLAAVIFYWCYGKYDRVDRQLNEAAERETHAQEPNETVTGDHKPKVDVEKGAE